MVLDWSIDCARMPLRRSTLPVHHLNRLALSCSWYEHFEKNEILCSNELDCILKRENLEMFLKGCETYGLKSQDLFQVNDLYEHKNLYMVVDCIFALGGMVCTQFNPIFIWNAWFLWSYFSIKWDTLTPILPVMIILYKIGTKEGIWWATTWG